MQETQYIWVQSLDGEDPPEEEMATHSSILAWRIPWTEEPGRLQSVGLQSQTRLKQLSMHTWKNCQRMDDGLTSCWVIFISFFVFLVFSDFLQWSCISLKIIEKIDIIYQSLYTLPCVNRELVGSCCIAQGAQLGALWWPRGVRWRAAGEAQNRGDIYIYIAAVHGVEKGQTQLWLNNNKQVIHIVV